MQLTTDVLINQVVFDRLQTLGELVIGEAELIQTLCFVRRSDPTRYRMMIWLSYVLRFTNRMVLY